MPSGRKRTWPSQSNVARSVLSQRRPQQLPPADNIFVCRVCHFPALDASGLLQHIAGSTHCSTSGHSTSALAAEDFGIGHDYDDDGDDGGGGNDDDENGYNDDDDDDDDDDGVGDEVAVGGAAYDYSSDEEEAIPDGVPHARALSLMINWSSSSDSEVEEEEEDEEDEESQEAATKNHGDKYEYYKEMDFPASIDDSAQVYLADLCRRIRAPLYAFDEIQNWAQEAYLGGYKFPTNAPTYKGLITSLRKRLGLGHLSHGTATIQKCGGGTLDFPVFEFESMFYDLIDDHRISPHLLIDFDTPNKPPSFNSQFLDEVHTGKWHRQTSQQLLKEKNDVLSGIIFFFDRTHVANKEKLSLCPLMFTLSIIPRSLRNQPFAWRPLGYFPKLPSAKKFGHNMDTLHRFLDFVLSGLVKAQRGGGVTCPVMAKDGREVLLCFKVPLCYVIGDVEGHDDLCARYGSHQTSRLNRECDCPTESADNPDVKCTYVKASLLTELRRKNDNETLKSFAFHNVTNAFDNVCFGANEFGINRATPSEVLHSIQKGWYLYALEGFYKGMGGQSVRDFLEGLVARVSMDCAHQSDRKMPRLRFANGILSYANLQAHETTGVLLLIVMSLHCKVGWDKHSKVAATKNSFARSHHCDFQHVKRYRDLFETLLCMEQWLKLPSVRKADVTAGAGHSESSAMFALRVAVKKFVKTVNRKEGMGMKLTKTHSVLHVPDDIAMFGSGKNWDSGPSESNHKENVKRKAALTNLCKHSLEDQVAARFEESLVIEHAKSLITENLQDGEAPAQPRCQEISGSKLKLTISLTTARYGIPSCYSIRATWDGKKKTKYAPECTLPLPPQNALEYVLEILTQALLRIPEGERPTNSTSPLVVKCFTDHKIYDTDGQLQIYRTHPAYRGGPAWNDWVYVEYCITSTQQGHRARNAFVNHLSKIILFLDLRVAILPNMTDIQGYVNPGTYAVVQTLEEQPKPVSTSVLLSTCTLSSEYYLVPTSSFVKPAFVVDNVGCPIRSLFVVPPMDEWADLFL